MRDREHEQREEQASGRRDRVVEYDVDAPERQHVPVPQHDPLTASNHRIGTAASIEPHANLIRRTAATRPAHTGRTLRQLQRRYGNQYVARMVDLARQDVAGAEVSPAVEASIQRARGGGQALDSGVRQQMEDALSVDFSGVRIHTDTAADTLNRVLAARAFTTGQDIFFRDGEYNPGSRAGRELLAHELTHVVQQGGGVCSGQAINKSPGIQEKSIETSLSLETLHRYPRLQRQEEAAPEAPSVVEITIERDSETAQATFGTLEVNGNPFQTLELPDRGNAATNNSATAGRILAGVYQAHVRTDGPRGWRLQLEGVPGRELIQIHVGNTPNDTTGCILIGTGRGENQVNNSVVARNQLRTIVENAGAGATIQVTITDAVGAEEEPAVVHPATLSQYPQSVLDKPINAQIQCKLILGQPGDIYEQEAERVARAVVQQEASVEMGRQMAEEDRLQCQQVPNPAQTTRQGAAEPPQATAGTVSVDDALRFIQQWEGRSNRVYNDTRGNRTIGVGFNLERADARQRIEAVGANFEQVLAGTQTLTDEQIDQLLRPGVEYAVNQGRNLVQNFENLPLDAQQIVVDMIFNLGAQGFANFVNARAALEQADFAAAADELQNSRWFRQTGNRARHHVDTLRHLAPPQPQQPGVAQQPESIQRSPFDDSWSSSEREIIRQDGVRVRRTVGIPDDMYKLEVEQVANAGAIAGRWYPSAVVDCVIRRQATGENKQADGGQNRAYAAEKLVEKLKTLGAVYRQEVNKEGESTRDWNNYALADCSKFVQWVLEETDEGELFTRQQAQTSKMRTIIEERLDQEKNAFRTENPAVGDIMLWGGHVGIVTEVVERGGTEYLVYASMGSSGANLLGKLIKNDKPIYWLKANDLNKIDEMGAGPFLGFWTP